MRTLSLLLATLIVVMSAASSAQTLVAEQDAWRALATSLEPGAFVTVRTKDGKRVTGTVLESTDDGIVLKPHTRIAVPARQVAYRDVESIERAKLGMKPGLKVLLGTGVGVGVLLVIAALVYASAGY